MACGWEGNRKSGVAQAMRQTRSLSTYELNGYGKGDEHPAYAPEDHGTLYVYLFSNVSIVDSSLSFK